MNQYAYYGKESTIHSFGQLSHFGLDLDDQCSAIPGHTQCMITLDCWIIPFIIVNGLTRMPMKPSTNEDLDHLPHVIITSNHSWNPAVLDQGRG